MGRRIAARATAHLPLHGGKAPPWLMRRMIEMGGLIAQAVVEHAGPGELLRRLSDPFWFQAFGCVLGFDWHSSGVTTTVCGALKGAYQRMGDDLGIVVCGGKGAASRRTPDEIAQACEHTGDDASRLVYASRLSAKVDSAAVQDGYELYHHAFLFQPGGPWCVVQQGMNTTNRYARRYHWLSSDVDDFVNEPHAAVASDARQSALNLVADEGDSNRKAATDLASWQPDKLLREVGPHVFEHRPLLDLHMPRRHRLSVDDIRPSQLKKVLLRTYEAQPERFEQLLGLPGVGAKTLRSLSLIAELIYNAPASRRDPAAYSFAHGGKDGHPYHVDRQLYDENIEFLRQMIGRSRISPQPQHEALRQLARFVEQLDASA